MDEFLSFLIVVAIIGFVIYLISRRKRKKQVNIVRKPFRVDTYSSNPSSSALSHQPTAIGNGRRMPHRTEDKEYMTFRNCPDCHSENEVNKQVIYKIGFNQFVCTVCGHRFKL